MVRSRSRRKKVNPTIWLYGDSILDNSYWNNVENNNTGQILHKSKKFNIKDKSTEEVQAETFTNAIKKNKIIKVSKHYVQHRKLIGYPYDGRVLKDGEAAININNTKIKKGDFVIISLGGNDIVLGQNLNTGEIIKNIETIIKFYKKKDAHVAYVIPYPPTTILALRFIAMGINPKKFYNEIVKKAKAMCKKMHITCISLTHFTDADRGNLHGIIPEPTIKGARKIAKLILKFAKN